MRVWAAALLLTLACLADVLMSDSRGGISKDSVDVNLTPPLIQHIIDNDLPAAYDLIASGENPNVRERPSGWTPLIYAANAGNIDLAQNLILAGADVNIGCVDGWTPLMFSSARGHVNMMKFLIDNGASIRQVSFNGATVLGCAKLSDITAAIDLIEDALQSSRLNEIFHDKHGVEAVILSASHTSNVALVEKLLQDGHNPNTISSGGWSPLMLASAAGCVPCMRLLLEHGAEVDYQDNDGWTALMFCAHSGNVEGVRLLVAFFADVLLTNIDDLNALHLARGEGHEEAFHTMIAGSFCTELRNNNVNRMMLMIEDGVDPNYVCASLANYTPLIVAVKAQDERAVELLVSDERVNVNAVEEDHWSPLMFASLRQSVRIIKLLLQRGADRELLTVQGYSVIRLAQMYNKQNDIVLGMLENGLEFTSSPSVYEESKEKQKAHYTNDIASDVIERASSDEGTKQSWSSFFGDLKRHTDYEQIKSYVHTMPDPKKGEKNSMMSLFGWR